jgi:hypothetical protein
MSASDIKLALQELVGFGVPLSVSTYVILVIGWLLSTAVGAFIGRYFGKRAETAAIQVDLDKIKGQLGQMTTTTEQIKAEISGELWLKQKRWDAKWQCYSSIVENLGELHTLISETIAFGSRHPPQGQDQAVHDSVIEKKGIEIDAAFQKVRRSGSIARIVVGPTVRTRLTRFGDEWNSALGDLNVQGIVSRQAWLEIQDAARVDLFGDPSEY